ncbi:SGNH/GDSL hydrolase family protein [Halomonas sp. hl-4]|uniref:SGNH/GDSL hydrolase family protein n=1 Tax=Halomonas sp. hl-4 TaxID=1761789 RepID=UPI000BB9A7E7|nr:SGNH/GDSL hydrolase family protein [Halomonas sp. hl-4]SNY97075.1 GDSL-like Lipase/Acylhydrolase family protein [Halomonas sp. hl-4]
MTTSSADWVTPMQSAFIKGAADIEYRGEALVPHRLPNWARDYYSDPGLAMAESMPAGVRLTLRTRARWIELNTRVTRFGYVGMPRRPEGQFELCVDGQCYSLATPKSATEISFDLSSGKTHQQSGDINSLRFDGLPEGDKKVDIWLPYNETVELFDLRSDAELLTDAESDQPIWLHYGSSISQGSNAASAAGIWPAQVAMQTGLDFVNLGFSGSALLDPFIARVIAHSEADLISLKLGINLVNSDVMRARAFGPAVLGFLDVIRDRQPYTPLLVISPLYCPIHETTPGPGAFDAQALAQGQIRFQATGNDEDSATGKLTLQSIRTQLAGLIHRRMSTDKHLFYLDGCELYGPDDHQRWPLPDALHPGPEAHQLIGQRFVERAPETGWARSTLGSLWPSQANSRQTGHAR